jgi:ABC-2 type transport system permease protein
MDSLKLYYKSFLLQLKTFRIYRVNFFASGIGTLFVYGTQLLGLVTALYHFESVHGWNLYDVSFLYGLWLASYGIHITFFAGVRDFASMVHRGQFDILYVRPHNLLFQVMCGRMDLQAMIHMGASALVLVWSTMHMDLQWSWNLVLKLAVILLGAVLIQMGLTLIWATLSFWLIHVGSLVLFGWTINANYMTYPLSVYDSVIRWIFTIFPMAFITYFPAGWFLGKFSPGSWEYQLGSFTVPVGLLFFLLAYAFWLYGTKHYKSTGN